MSRLERGYRRLPRLYPAEHGRQYEQEMLGVLLAAAPEGRRRPSAADAVDRSSGHFGPERQPDAAELAVAAAALVVALVLVGARVRRTP